MRLQFYSGRWENFLYDRLLKKPCEHKQRKIMLVPCLLHLTKRKKKHSTESIKIRSTFFRHISKREAFLYAFQPQLLVKRCLGNFVLLFPSLPLLLLTFLIAHCLFVLNHIFQLADPSLDDEVLFYKL